MPNSFLQNMGKQILEKNRGFSQYLKDSGYAPGTNPVDWKPDYPLSDYDKQTLGVNDAPPAEWDYKTSTVGMDGSPMPQGAVGWHPNGEPYYGGGGPLEDWWRGWQAKFSAGGVKAQAPVYGEYKPATDAAWTTAREKLANGDLWGVLDVATAIGSGAIGFVGDLAEGAGNILGSGLAEGETPGEAAKKGNLLAAAPAAVGQFTNELFNGLIAGAQQFAQWFEQGRGGLRGASEAVYGDNPEGVLSKWAAEDTNTPEWFKSLVFSIDIPGFIQEFATAGAAFLTDSEKAKQGFVEGNQAGRILYTTFKDETIRAEFMRRFRAGESPYLLAEELQDPTSEMAGQIFADPLNILGWVGKGARALGWTRASKTAVASVIDEVAKLGDNAINVIDDATAGVAKANLVDAVTTGMARVRSGVSTRTFGLKELSPHAARMNLTERAGFLFKTMAVQYGKKNFDDLIEASEALMRLHGNPASVEVALGIIKKSKVPSNVLLSPTAGELGYVLREMVTDGGTLKPQLLLDELAKAESVEDVLKAFSGKLDDALYRLVPDTKTIEGPLGVAGNVVKKAEQLTQSRFYVGAKGFYGTVFLGANPGYYFRAGFTDWIHMFADDPAAAFVHVKNRIFSPKAADDFLVKVNGDIPDAVKQSFGPAEVKGWGAAKEAGKTQTNMGKTLWAVTQKKSLRSLRKPMFQPEMVSRMREAGANDELIRFMERNLNEVHDVNAVAEEVIKSIDNGYMDKFDSYGWMNDVQHGVLDDFQYLDRYKSGLDEAKALADDVESVVGRHNEFFDGIEDYAKEAAKTPVGMPPAVVDQADTIIAKAADDGLLHKSIEELSRQQKIYNFEAQQSWQDAVGLALERVKNIGAQKNLDDLLLKKPQLRNVLNDSFLKSQGDYFQAWSDAKHAVFQAVKKGTLEPVDAWKKLGFKGEFPAAMTKERTLRAFYSDVYYPATRQYFKDVRDAFIGMSNELLTALKELDPRLVDDTAIKHAVEDAVRAQVWDEVSLAGNGLGAYKSQKDAIYALADMNGIATVSKTGKPLLRVIRDTIKKYLPDAEKYADDAVIPFEVAEEAFKARAVAMGEEFIPLSHRPAKLTQPVVADLIPPLARAQDGAVLGPRVISEQIGGFKKLRVELEEAIRKNYGQVTPVSNNSALVDAVREWEKTAMAMEFEAKLVSGRVAKAARDFAFLPYLDGKTNLDTILAVIYPYSFWHTRTYVNWFKRLSSSPDLIAAYAKYRDMMGEIHAGAPEWWKWNVRSDELLGTPSDNPLFFNLEASLNPLNGLLGVDFNDGEKRINWWTTALDDMNKWGPAAWPFFNIATALALKMTGEQEAAALWADRLFPQSRAIEAIGNLAGMDTFSVDPFTHLFSNGVDPRLANAAGRALGTMVLKGQISQEEAEDAAATQTGQIWMDAMRLAQSERSPGQLMSFFLGTGFRARSIGDMETDKFDAEYGKLWNLRNSDMVSPEQFNEGMNRLREQYPFMEALLLARKDSEERDAALAWVIMRRLPPSGSDISKAAGISKDLLNRWYDTQGDWSTWEQSDKDRFMAGITDMRVILAIPTDATREEWTEARNAYKSISAELAGLFGANINNKTDLYFQIKAEQGQDAGRAYLDANPDVSQALDYKSKAVMMNPLLNAYYGGIDDTVRYYKGIMYSMAEQKFGDDIFDLQSQYFLLDDEVGYKEANAFLRDNPQIQKYWDFKDEYERSVIIPKLSAFESLLPTGAEIRPNVTPATQAQEDIVEAVQPPPQIDLQAVFSQLGQEASNLVMDFVINGQAIPYTVRNKLERIAEEMGVSYYELLQLIQQGAQVSP